RHVRAVLRHARGLEVDPSASVGRAVGDGEVVVREGVHAGGGVEEVARARAVRAARDARTTGRPGIALLADLDGAVPADLRAEPGRVPAADHDELSDALVVDQRLDRALVAGAGAGLAERGRELRLRFGEAVRVDRSTLQRRLRVAAELARGLLARRLQPGALALAGVRKRGPHLVAAVVDAVRAVELDAAAGPGRAERRAELGGHLAVARRLERRGALGRDLRLAGEEALRLLREGLQL